jgi:hypothetical protein
LKITNNNKLPSVLVKAIKNSQREYDNGGSNLSASSATIPPRQYWLKKRHDAEIEVDAQDLIWSFVGTSLHYTAEMAAKGEKNIIAEVRYFKEILGWKISAQIDNYDTKTETLTDFKISSVYSMIGAPKPEYVVQLSIQAMLMKDHGYDVKKAQLCVIGRDWMAAKAGQNDYPKHQVKLMPAKIMSYNETMSYLVERISILQSHENTPDDELPLCTAEERWEDSPTFAYYKDDKAKRATKLFDSALAADIHKNEQGCGFVVKRDAEPKRCKSYCDVWRWCSKGMEVRGE